MQEIKCPNCGAIFQVDEAGYDKIAKQIRDKEFEKELKRQKEELSSKFEKDITIKRMEDEKKFTESINKKELELSEKDKQIIDLKSKLDESENMKNLAVSVALEENKEKHNTELQEQQNLLKQKDSELAESAKKIAEQLNTITELKSKIEISETEKKLAVNEALEKKNEELSQKNSEITELKGELKNKETESRLNEKSLQEKYEEKLKLKDEQIEYYKDFKARQSTKMIGESLEQHCLTQFNSLRMTAFQKAYFEKDNDAKTGSKGDFIYRESDDNGVEFISIMFEMKNEADMTATKHRNEDFFKELDKDRREKNCEYAVLVSLLEIDSDYYNNGIVDVSYKYPKMYVVRPQFFIPIITLLRNASLNSLAYRQELESIKNQQIDIMNFESNINAFKESFAMNYERASKNFNEAIDEIDKTIACLEKIKQKLLLSDKNLRIANNKTDELSIKKLTKNAPAVKAMFDEIKKNDDGKNINNHGNFRDFTEV